MGTGCIELWLLFEQPDTDRLGCFNHTGIGLVESGENLQKRGFSAPVGADQPDTVSGADFQSEPGKYRIGVELTSQISGGKQDHEAGRRRWPMVVHWPTMANGFEGSLRTFGSAVQIQEMAKR